MPEGFRSVQVETSLTSDSHVEIKSSLSEGDVVYVAQSISSNNSNFMMMPDGGAMGGNSGRGGMEVPR